MPSGQTFDNPENMVRWQQSHDGFSRTNVGNESSKQIGSLLFDEARFTACLQRLLVFLVACSLTRISPSMIRSPMCMRSLSTAAVSGNEKM